MFSLQNILNYNNISSFATVIQLHPSLIEKSNFLHSPLVIDYSATLSLRYFVSRFRESPEMETLAANASSFDIRYF